MSSVKRKQPKVSKTDATEYVLRDDIICHPRFPANTDIAQPPAAPDPWILDKDLLYLQFQFGSDSDEDDSDVSQCSSSEDHYFVDEDLGRSFGEGSGASKAFPLSSGADFRKPVVGDRLVTKNNSEGICVCRGPTCGEDSRGWDDLNSKLTDRFITALRDVQQGKRKAMATDIFSEADGKESRKKR